MKPYILIIALALSLGSLQAQRTGFSFTGGIGTYDLGDLKIYQDELINRMPVNLIGYSYFPPFTSIKLNLFKQLPGGLKYGLIYGHSSTGAHANYADNSGYMNVDQNITAFQLGAGASYRLFYTNFIEILTYGDLRLSYVKNKANVNIVTNYFYQNNYINLKTVSPFTELGFEFLVHFNKISCGVETGYLYDFGVKFKAGEESVATPLYSLRPYTDYRSNMSGFRAGVKIVLWLDTEITP